MDKFIYLAAFISTSVTFFGLEGHGRWSKNIAVVGGIFWFVTNIGAFYYLGWFKGLLVLLATFIFGGILQILLRRILNPRGYPPHNL